MMEVQEQIAQRLYQRGVSHDTVLRAVDVIDEGYQRRTGTRTSISLRLLNTSQHSKDASRTDDGDEILLRQEPPAQPPPPSSGV
jgi:hypothetical protein